MNPSDILGIACASVGVGPGGCISLLARVVIVDFRGQTILDVFVLPTMEVQDYRGINAAHLSPNSAVRFENVQRRVADLIIGKTIVGHCLWNDLSVLGMTHPASATRDVALYRPFRNALNSPNQVISLRSLMWHLMCRHCEDGEFNPLEKARASLDLYRSDARTWEQTISMGIWPCHLPPSNFSCCYS